MIIYQDYPLSLSQFYCSKFLLPPTLSQRQSIVWQQHDHDWGSSWLSHLHLFTNDYLHHSLWCVFWCVLRIVAYFRWWGTHVLMVHFMFAKVTWQWSWRTFSTIRQSYSPSLSRCQWSLYSGNGPLGIGHFKSTSGNIQSSYMPSFTTSRLSITHQIDPSLFLPPSSPPPHFLH